MTPKKIKEYRGRVDWLEKIINIPKAKVYTTKKRFFSKNFKSSNLPKIKGIKNKRKV